jgi:hypothetical protein
MTLNREVYEKDPSENRLLNHGVAKVTTGDTDSEIETLRFEIRKFVCDGQYADGLDRILSQYLANLDQSEQPGVWVSGFFGSGKSHLVKVLQHLWLDYQFPDGARARGLAKLPQHIKDLLTELSNQAKKYGGLHAAAGSLGDWTGDSVRLGLLSIVFKSVGLPPTYSRASFVLWLREEGLEDAVRNHVQQAGGDFERELANLYVSDFIANSLIAARPGFADKASDARLLLQKQFPSVSDVSIDDMIDRIRQALLRKKKLPLTVILLDEVQQYIGDTLARSKGVQDLQEQCCSRLGANILFVATGQNALTGVPLLQKLTGRFPIKVELQDTDVEKVTREVLLKKKPSAEAGLKSLLESHSGEIERHLSATKIASTTRDRGLLVQDYPVLPVRRRFWERILRAVDKAGTGAQLRNQLSIVEAAVEQTANWALGNVVSGAFIYDASVQSSALKSGVLLQAIAETIAQQKQEDDGELRYQICALIFLIGQLPHQGPADAGIRATSETLADLLVTDLNVSSADLRKKVPELLEKLVASGAVMPVEDEYRMQTREGSEWNQAYLESMNKLLGDAAKLGGERSQLLKTQSSDALKKLKLTHGESKVARDIALDFGSEAPTTGGTTVPVWLRDGWEVEEKTVIDDARVAGDSAAVVYGFIPRRQAEELKRAIAGHYAASATITAKGNPSTPEGIEARKAMETRQEQTRQARDSIIAEILNETAIYIAGGGEPLGGTVLADKVQLAAKACLDRLYPDFHKADAPAKDWLKVIERSKKGDGDALAAVGYQGDADKHPVCTAVHAFVGSGKKGTEIRKHFGAPPYGWPQDAVDAALIVMFNTGLLQARAGNEPVAKQKLDQKNITATDFRVENITLSTAQLIEVRKVFKAAGLKVDPGKEAATAASFLEIMHHRALAAGGAPPLPARPDVAHLTDIANRAGNDQLKAIFDVKDRLTKEATDWQKRAERIREREPNWRVLKALLSHAGELAVSADVQPEVDSVEQHRRLLGEPDSVPGLLDKLAQALREALNEASATCEQLQQEGQAMLATSATWRQLSLDQQTALADQYELNVLPQLAVGTTDEILQSLSATRLKEWKTLADAIPARFGQALAVAAKLLEPKAQRVKLAGGTIKNEDDLRGWLTTAEQQIRDKLKDGPVII